MKNLLVYQNILQIKVFFLILYSGLEIIQSKIINDNSAILKTIIIVINIVAVIKLTFLSIKPHNTECYLVQYY